jgi:hypothetical protein
VQAARQIGSANGMLLGPYQIDQQASAAVAGVGTPGSCAGFVGR